MDGAWVMLPPVCRNYQEAGQKAEVLVVEGPQLVQGLLQRPWQPSQDQLVA